MEAACSFDKARNSFSFTHVVAQRREAKTGFPTGSGYLRYGIGCNRVPSPFVVSSMKNLSSPCRLAGFGPHFVGSSDGAFASYQTPEFSFVMDLCFVSFPASERGASPSAVLTFSGRRKIAGVECKCLPSSSSTGSMASTVESRRLGSYGGTVLGLPSTGVLTVVVAVRFPAQSGTKGYSYYNKFFVRGRRAGDQRPREQRVLRFSTSLLKGSKSPFGSSHRMCEATGQSGTGQSVPEEENRGHASEQSEQSVTEHNAEGSNNPNNATNDDKSSGVPVASLGTRWAHSILAPEAGCVLIATDKIDGQEGFERSVILLLSPGSSKPREGPYGLILNRPLSCCIMDIKPEDRTLVKIFGNCQVHHGGPLDEDMFLVLHGTAGVRGYREVIPGVYYGAASGLEEIIKGHGPMDYRFFFGYSGWSVDQLKKEIAAGLWCVAACSTDLITGHVAAGLWEEILLLMGGKYGELSKRPRRRHF